MRRTTNARVAGFTFLLYIAIGITQMVLSPGGGAQGTAARLALLARHAPEVRINMLLGVLTGFCAVVLAVALYGLTREEDHELAVFALACRVAEGVLGAIPISLGLLWLANAAGSPDASDPAAANVLGALLLKAGSWRTTVSSIFFAAGSTAFSYLLLRGRMIPISLAWLGVIASVLLLAMLPLQLAGVVSGAIAQLAWIPMAGFEIPLGVWLLVRGAASPRVGTV